MTNSKIKKTISKGEGLRIEFKKAKNKLPNNLFETICAFLNKTGGEILLGISDDKKIIGIDENKIEELCKQIGNLSNNPQKLFPSFLLEPKIVDYKEKKLIYIFVPISSQVHKTDGKIYDRSSDGDYELKTDDQIKNIYRRKSNEYSENRIYPFLKESDFADGIVERTRKLIKINRSNHPWNDLSNQEFFLISGLYRHDYHTGKEGFTLTAALLFGKPEVINSIIPHYKVDALVRINDIDRYDDRENIRDNLIESYDKIMAFVEKHLPDKFYLQGTQRISLRDKIFREIIANMLIHREYINAYPSTFIIYKNKVIAKNANKAHFFGKLTPNNFEPFPKNPDIARIFTQIGHSEELGTGIRKVYKYSKPYSGSEEIEFNEEDIFITIVPLGIDNALVNAPVSAPVNAPVNQTQKDIVKAMQNNSNISYNEIAQIIEKDRTTVMRNIQKLKELGIIKRIGSDKTGYWEVIE